MSLMVYPYHRNQQGELIALAEAIAPNFTDLFGLEIWRDKVWGAQTLIELGCKILPSLRKTDIYAEDTELLQLEEELKDVLHQLDKLATLLKVDASSLYHRVQNALEAIRIAKAYPDGGVYIG